MNGIIAASINNRIIVTIEDDNTKQYWLYRKEYKSEEWLIFCGSAGFLPEDEVSKESTEDESVTVAQSVTAGDILDNHSLSKTLYAYRYIDTLKEDPEETDYVYSNWVRNGGEDAIGYTFGNYKVPEGKWGTVVTPDDMRYTYLWGTDFKATNGQSFTDEQIDFFILSAMESVSRQLDITIPKKRIRCNAKDRNLEKKVDYDVEEDLYDFKYNRISRYGLIKTRQRPIIALHNLQLYSRVGPQKQLKEKTIVDKTKGLLKLMERPIRPSDTWQNIQNSVSMYGQETLNNHLFYAIDYDVGFETSDDIPDDLREIIAKRAAVSLLNIVGDGLMSGFSSSSLSMDGVSESFSSTQSATSAYFGARIKEYKDDIDAYIQANKQKFGHMTIGAL